MTTEVGRGGVSPQLNEERGQKVCHIIQSDIPRNSVNKDMHCEHTRQNGAKKYLGESCYYRIKCSAANSPAALMWRRPLNSAALATPTHRGPKRISDGTSTQVVTWAINKWRGKII